MGVSQQLTRVLNSFFAARGTLQLHPGHHRAGHDTNRSSADAGANVEPHITDPHDSAEQQTIDLRCASYCCQIDTPIERPAPRRSL